MSPHVWLAVVTATLALAALPPRGLAHIPWFRPLLLQLVRDSHCIVSAKVTPVAADSRGRGVIWLERPTAWCEEPPLPRVALRTQTVLPSNAWFVLFLRADPTGWTDIAPQGVVFPLDRRDQRVVHRALRRLLKYTRTGNAIALRQALFELLEARGEHWRYHAALALRELSRGPANVDHLERTRLRQLLETERDPAVRALLQPLINAPLGPEE
ncbi:MAG: hypothetical protein ONB06_09310 [candidate division KSB1 bacterium]|nr:hypothetical protein [candidate division KSB1 bacterium]